jgi:hypothetical protein
MLNLCRESRGYIHSFKSSRENVKHGPHTLGWSKVQLTLVISNLMGPWKKFESTVVRLKRSYENTGSVFCLTTKGRQLKQNFEELKPASHV